MEVYCAAMFAASCLSGATVNTIRSDARGWQHWLGITAMGFFPAYFLGPWLCDVAAASGRLDWITWGSPHAQTALGFVLGLFGNVATRGGVAAGEAYGGEVLAGFLCRCFGLPPRPPAPPAPPMPPLP